MSCLRCAHIVTVFCSFLITASTRSSAQLTVTASQPATVLANKLAGPGIAISGATLTCPGVANGIFRVVPGTILGTGTTAFSIDSGVLLTSGHAIDAAGTEPTLASSNDGAPGDASLAALVGTTTYDACVLEFDFVPAGDTVKFNYQFGSEEYNHSTCGQYNDPFAFFISGPGITGTQNMALVPGTTIPVAVNSVNSGVPGPLSMCPTCAISNCTSMGPGSPFTSFFVDNTGGSYFTYKGFTQKFAAVHSVIPCNSYHLKLAICDASNKVYDSGVFLEAGSLTTNSYTFNRADSLGATIDGLSHAIVKGCAPATIHIAAAHANGTSQTIHLLFGGTAINGVDIATVADSVILPADSTNVSFNITGLPTPVGGIKTFTIYLESGCAISDSITLNILDSPSAHILTPDTTICPGQAFQVRVNGTPGLTYSWAVAAGLSSTTVMEPIAYPSVSTIYTMTATLPNSGCANIVRTLSITTTGIGVLLLTPDTSICIGQSVHIRLSGSDSNSYAWTPPATLDSANIKQPTATPITTTTYTVIATSTAGCTAMQTITISIVNVTAAISNPDTAICRGAYVEVRAVGDPTLTYQWLPTAGIPLSTILDPVITPDTSATYYLTVNIPGCSTYLDSITIDVQPNPVVFIGGRRMLCQFDTVHLQALVTPDWYKHYIYNWSPATFLDNPSASAVVYTAGNSGKLVLHVNTPAGCSSADSTNIVVHGSIPDTLADVDLCPGDSVQLLPHTGAAAYHWSPALYLSDSLSPAPWVHAVTSQTYRLVATNEFGCSDTAKVTVTMRSNAVIWLGDSVTIYPGESYQINPQTNCSYFSWFPAAGLDNATVSNPVASPEISTKYIVHARTEWGCAVTDSINIYVDPGTVLTLPNAFTPGSGPNNVYKIIKRGIATLHYFRIYNRWANLVFETSDIDAGWDGTYKGAPQPFSVFVYEVEAETNTGRVFRQHGNLTLLR